MAMMQNSIPQGTIIEVNGSRYIEQNGKIVLPSYPTLPAHVGFKVKTGGDFTTAELKPGEWGGIY